MSYKKTLIFFLVFFFLAGFFYLYEIKGGEKRTEAEEQAKLIASFKPEDVSSVSIGRPSETIVVEKKGNDWEVVKPVAAPAEQGKVDQLLKTASSLKYERDLGQQNELEPFKLAEPELSIEVAGEQKKLAQLSIGASTPDGKNFYVKSEKSDQVYTASAADKKQLDQTLFELRDKRIFNFETPDITALTLRREGQSLDLEKKDEQWTIPALSGRDADSEKVAEFLNALKYARVKKFAEEKAADLETYGLVQPQAQVEIAIGDKQETISFGKEVGPAAKLVYAAKADGHQVLELDESLLEKIAVEPVDWRDRRIAKIKPDKVNKLEVKGIETDVAVERDANDPAQWTMVEPRKAQADSSRIDSMLNRLSRAKVLSFVKDDKLKEAKRLLEESQIRLKIWKKEKEQPLELAFAPAKQEKQWLVQSPDEIALIGEEFVKELKVTPDDLVDKSVVRFTPADIEKIDLVKDEKTYSLKRKDADWDIPRSVKMEQYEVEQLLWDLHELKYAQKPTPTEELARKVDSPVLRIQLWEKQSEKPIAVLSVGRRIEAKGSLYPVRAGAGEIMQADAPFVTDLLKKLE